jgi:DNA polymerase-3 subunit alpha
MFKSPKEFIGKELIIAGVITDLEHRVSRQGKGWASFTLEDYVDSYEFRIFGEDYLKYKHLLILNNFIHIKTAIVEGWKNKETGIVGDPRIQYRNFKLLQDVVKSFARKLSIQLNLDDIKENKIKEIKQLLVKHKGDHNLSFVVYDEEEKIKIDMKTSNHKINISPELLEILDQEKIYYKLN